MYQRTRTEWSRHLDFVLIDFLCLQIAYVFAYWLRFGMATVPYSEKDYLSLALIMALSLVVSTLILNSYAGILKRKLAAETVNVFLAAFLMLAIVILYLYSVHTAEFFSRLLVYYTVVIFSLLSIACRSMWKKVALKKHNSGHGGSKSLLVVAPSSDAEKVIKDILGDASSVYHIKGLVFTDCDEYSEICGISVVSSLENAADYICREWVDAVYVCQQEKNPKVDMLMTECAEMGVTVHTAIKLRNVDRNKQFIEEMGSNTVLTTAFNYVAPYQAFIKRFVDIVGGIVGCIFAVLIGIVIGPVIYINSPGPIIFKQKRIGRNGKIFNVLKFRSMYLDAEERKKEYMSQNRVSDGMMFKLDFDPRIIGNKVTPDGTKKTGIGEFIRKTSLDEFPQFFNVLKGDMSLVGTRPPTVDEWEKYQYHHRARLAIKPGITGMWQVSGRSDITDFEEVVRLDTDYICNFRLSLDIKILFKTVAVLFQRKGAM